MSEFELYGASSPSQLERFQGLCKLATSDFILLSFQRLRCTKPVRTFYRCFTAVRRPKQRQYQVPRVRLITESHPANQTAANARPTGFCKLMVSHELRRVTRCFRPSSISSQSPANTRYAQNARKRLERRGRLAWITNATASRAGKPRASM